MTALLKITNLTVTYGPIQALRGVSLEIQKGEIVSVLGPDGAGKSTLLNTISRLLAIKAGTIEYAGAPINDLLPSETIMRGIAPVPEGRGVIDTMTVEENLAMGAYTRGSDRKRMRNERERAYFTFPRLTPKRHRLAGTLPEGERQMLAMAQGLMSSPRLLLLDEPSRGLNPLIAEELFYSIRMISRQGTSVLLLGENVREALEVGHRVYVLEAGQVILSGPSGEVKGHRKIQDLCLGKTALVNPRAS